MREARHVSFWTPFTRGTAPIVYATLIVVAAVVPVLFIEGLTGAFFKPLIAAYVLAIAASLIVAMTVTPALCLILLNNARLEGRESPVVLGCCAITRR